MSILYRPVLIESADRAAALPAGTPAYIDVIGGPARYSAVKTPAGDWYIGGSEYHENSEMTRWTALEAIEVEEVPETFRDRRGPGLNDHRTVYRTPWEEG